MLLGISLLHVLPTAFASTAQPCPALILPCLQAGLLAGKYASPMQLLEHAQLVRRGAMHTWRRPHCSRRLLTRRRLQLAVLRARLPPQLAPFSSAAPSQVWANCRTYNDPASAIQAQCNDTQRAFDAAWRLEGLPFDPATWQPQRAAQLRQEAAARLAAMTPEQRAHLVAALAGAPLPAARPTQAAGAGSRPSTGGGSTGSKPAVKRKLSEGAAASGVSPAMPGGHGPASGRAAPAPKRTRMDSGDWQTRAMHALNTLMRLEASEAFHEPVRSALKACSF